uniref:Uncharacterized protein n=1 Tax=Amphimedon queenslandica TaxID=400682 RepID=A0A1X7TPD9_AMPQE
MVIHLSDQGQSPGVGTVSRDRVEPKALSIRGSGDFMDESCVKGDPPRDEWLTGVLGGSALSRSGGVGTELAGACLFRQVPRRPARQEICKKLFLFVYSIRNGTYKNLRRHFLQNGIKPRVHGNTGRIPCHALSVQGIKDVVAFLENYAEDYTILLPGRIPGVRDYGKAKLLPSSVSRRKVYRQYADAGREHTLCEKLICFKVLLVQIEYRRVKVKAHSLSQDLNKEVAFSVNGIMDAHVLT